MVTAPAGSDVSSVMLRFLVRCLALRITRRKRVVARQSLSHQVLRAARALGPERRDRVRAVDDVAAEPAEDGGHGHASSHRTSGASARTYSGCRGWPSFVVPRHQSSGVI